MSYAQIAGQYMHAWCRAKWPEPMAHQTDSAQMASTMANGSMIDVFDHKGHGTHKYIPADRLTQDIGEPLGAGVYAYWKMADDSFLLLTCNGRLAHWDGTPEGKAEWIP